MDDYSPTGPDRTSRSRTIAVVSGKGGSGKTMIAAVMTKVLSLFQGVTLVDADTGTGGLSYYLGLKLVGNTAVGLADLLLENGDSKPLPLQAIAWNEEPKPKVEPTFLSIGNHRRLYQMGQGDGLAEKLWSVIQRVNAEAEYVIIDCRGGIDSESIAVCDLADDIILIVEPDTTSFQATQHVVDVLSNRNLAGKLRGFIINKVFDDPSTVANYGTSVFKCGCLAAVPFDLEATRDFLIGNIPRFDTQFGIQVWQALRKAYRDTVEAPPPGRAWTFEEFSQVSLANPESSRGGLVAASLLLIFGAVIAMRWLENRSFFYSSDRLDLLVAVTICVLLGIMGSLEPTRRRIGRAFGMYVRAMARLLGAGVRR